MNRKKKIITAIIAIIIIFCFYRIINYGSITRTCNYTVQDINLPLELSTKYIKTTQTSASVTNYDSFACLGGVFAEGNTITENRYTYIFEHNPNTVISNIPEGSEFNIIGIKEVTKHGISTIDSGPGPSYFLILKDDLDKIYFLCTSCLGINDSDRFMALVDTDGKETIIGPDNFYDYKSFKFKLMLNE